MKYNTIAEVFDLGPFINKIVLELDQTIPNCKLDSDTFQVYVVRRDRKTGEVIKVRKSWESEEVFPSEGERKVINTYVSDKEGRNSQSGSFITLEMEVDPRISLGSTITFNGIFNVFVAAEYKITQQKPIIAGNSKLEKLVFDEQNTERTLLAEEFSTGKSDYQGITLTYASYEPKTGEDKKPLLIWLHGAGEGGTDPLIAVSGNKVVNLISNQIQQFFKSSYVLGPQAPTMWMDDGTGNYNTDGSSMYVENLKHLIDEYLQEHEDIDRDRIYIGGCSNGGFMTMKMIIAYPEMFAAAYPICEALGDQYISEEDINRIRHIPIWFTNSTSDPVVPSDKHTEATYKRLVQAKAPEVHFSCYSSITDNTGKYNNPDNTPFQYNGHFSWIPALNNECVSESEGKVTLFEWLAKQKRQN